MALLWADGFEHYGVGAVGRDNMLNGAYGFVHADCQPSAAQSRTGGRSLSVFGQTSSNSTFWRRVFPTNKLNFGFAMGLYLTALPSNPHRMGWQIWGNTGVPIYTINIATDGSLMLKAGNSAAGNPPLVTSDPVLTAEAFNYIECEMLIDSVVGECEIRVNGVTVIHMTDANFGTQPAASICGGKRLEGNPTGTWSGSPTMYFDDLVAWDKEGGNFNDFPGPVRVTTIYCDGDTAEDDWAVVGAGSGYEAINDAVPDMDSTYISSDNPGDVSEFTVGELPAEITTISAVYVPVLGRLENAGIGDVKVSMVSDTEVDEGPSHPLTPVYTYRGTSFETDPNTGTAWTKSTLEAALLRIEKTV